MSKLLDENSSPCTKSELYLFTVPSTQVAVRKPFWSEVQLQNPCTNDGPYEFRISPDLYMVDMSKNYVYFLLRIVKPDGSTCKITKANNDGDEGDTIVPINLLGKTFFRQIKIFLNGKLISDSSDKYAYRSIMETELNFGESAKNSQLQAGLYYRDNEEGQQKRMSMFKNSSWVELMAPIHADIFIQDHFLISQCELCLEMYRNSDAFCLMHTTGTPDIAYKLEVKHMSFFIKKVEVAENISMAIETMLQKTSVKYPIRRTQITTLHVTENRRSTPLNSLFNGISPRRLVIGMVAAEAARGSYKNKPFHFKNFGISEIKISSGTVTVPSTPFKLDFSNGKYIRAFIQMFEGLDIAGDDKGNMIDRDSYNDGSTFFVFELGADGTDSSNWELIRKGTTTLEIQFDKDLPAGGIECVIYAEFDSLLMIDHTRQAFMDYTV